MSEAGVAAPFRFGLLGSPNSGKTTLFNALTGLRARVGNYPGVTVERCEGRAEIDGRRMVVIGLPGTYSLAAISPDEAIVSRVLAGEVAQVPAPDALIVTMDACSLERSLLLLAQALRQRKPTCLVLTMVDEFRARGGKINLPRLSNALGIPVVGVVGHRGLGVDKLRRLLGRSEDWIRPHMLPPEGAEDRAAWLDSILSNVVSTRPGRNRVSDAVDRVVLHPLAGSLLFAGVMVLFFQLIFSWATPAMDAIDVAVGWMAQSLSALSGHHRQHTY